jgi:AcrR family transcriptional regulator
LHKRSNLCAPLYADVNLTAKPHKLPGVSKPEHPSGAGKAGLPSLPPGRHGLPREFVVKNQRERLAAAMIQVIAERGFYATTITQIAAAAGVSRRTFYGYFKTKQEAFFETYAMVSDFLFAAMAETGEAQRGWPARVRAELAVLLEAFAANPDLVRFALIAPPAAGGEIAAAYRGFLGRLLELLGEGRPKSVRRPSVAAEHGLIGGLAALVVDKVKAGEGERLTELAPDLLELVLTPYLGRQRAIAEARR